MDLTRDGQTAENIAERIKDVTAELVKIGQEPGTAGSLPNYPGGLDHQGYKEKLIAELEMLNGLREEYRSAEGQTDDSAAAETGDFLETNIAF